MTTQRAALQGAPAVAMSRSLTFAAAESSRLAFVTWKIRGAGPGRIWPGTAVVLTHENVPPGVLGVTIE